MGKKVVLTIFAIIAISGLALTLIGYALGGHGGSLRVSDNELVYHSAGEEIPLGNAPYWLRNLRFPSRFPFLTGWNSWDGEKHWYDSESHSAAQSSAGNGQFQATAGNFSKMELDISVGYVVVQTGNEPGIIVNGPLSYSSSVVDGVWTLASIHPTNNITTHGTDEKGRTRFWHNGQDITTEYIITVPKEFAELDAELALGSMLIDGLALREGDFSAELGEMTVRNCTVIDAEFSVELGALKVENFAGTNCSLYADLGGVEFQGSVSGIFKAECGMGSIQATVPRPANYAWKMDCDLGSITLGNDQKSGEFTANSGLESTRPFFDLKCGMGSINVQFE